MREFSVTGLIPRPALYLLRLFAEYTHVERIHAHRGVWVEPMYENGDVSICRWHIKVMGMVRVSRQLQIVYPDDLKMVNETLDGFGRGTIDTLVLKETDKGTGITETVQLKMPLHLLWMERPVESFTKAFIKGFYEDHLADENKG